MTDTGSARDLDNEKTGHGKPPIKNRFSSTNQPDRLKIKSTKMKKKFTRDTIKEMLSLRYKFTPDSKIKQQLIDNYGPDVIEMTIAEVMTLQQMQKAILKGDTYAFNTLLDQGLGRQVQGVSNVDADGNTIQQQQIFLSLPPGMDISLPSDIEGDE